MPATSRVGSTASCRSTSAQRARAKLSLRQIRHTPLFGSCSAWPSRSQAHQCRVGRVVGDDQDLGRAGQQVDADAAEELALGLGHVLVARAAQHVHRLDVADAEGHRGDGRHAAQDEDPVGAALCMALTVAGCSPPLTGGVQATTRFTPATLAGMMLICAEPNIG